MARFVLHIGYGKTGTTAIQRFLQHNRPSLANARTLYPDFFAHGAWLNVYDHNFLGHALAGRIGWWGQSAEQLLGQIKEQARIRVAETIIVSAETFLGGVEPWEFDDEVAYRHACRSAVNRLAQALTGHTVEIVVYLRRQDHWLESCLNQNIKYAGLLSPKIASASVDDTCRIYAKRTDYAAALAPWRAAFGREAISVGVYERGQLNGGDILSDFRARIGLTQSDLTNPAWDGLTANRGLSRDVLEVKKILNRFSRPKFEEITIVECLHRISGALSSNDREAPVSILSTAQRLSILDGVAKSNAEVARIYLERPDGVLFRDAPPDHRNCEWDYAGLDRSVAIEILSRLDRELRSVHGRARLFRHWLGEKLRGHSPWMHGLARRLHTPINWLVRQRDTHTD